LLTMRFSISSGWRPGKLQTTEMTGMSMSGKMSFGIPRIVTTPRMAMRNAITTKVYGRLSATRTSHIMAERALYAAGMARRPLG